MDVLSAPPTGGPAGVADPDALRSILLLQRLPGVGDVGLEALVEHFGGATAALRAGRDAFARVVGPAAADARTDPERVGRVVEGLAWCAANGVLAVHRWGEGYPSSLEGMSTPPAVLFFKGDRSLLDAEIVTVVGSRRSTEYGRRVARELAEAAVRHGVVVASGLALGVDGEAHRATLEAGGRTIAVLGSGLACPHPRSHLGLFRRIAREGLLVSEFLPGEPPLPHHFPQRNRTLAGLASLVVVVEAARRSGALNTARHAIDLGRDVVAVPGPIHAPTSRGTNDLLSVVSPLVSMETLREYFPRVSQTALALEEAGPPGELGRQVLQVWSALEAAPRHVDDLAERSALPSGETLVALSLLEVEGWVRQEPGARFARRTSCS